MKKKKNVLLKTETRSEAEGRKSPAPGPASTTKPATKVNEKANISLRPLSEQTVRYQPACRRQEAQMVSAFSRLFAPCVSAASPPSAALLSLLLLLFFFFCEMR